MSTLLIQIAVGAGIFLAGVAGGIKWHAGQDAIKQVAAEVNQRATERMRRQNANTAAVVHETQKEKTRTEFVTITERVRDEIEVEKLVYRNVCISPGGLRELANAARATGYTGELGSTVPPDPPAK